MARKSSELKKRCWLAKQRLKMGYWESLKLEKQQSSAVGVRASAMAVGMSHTRFLRESDMSVGVAAAAADEKMYKKVCDILDSSEVALNPIGQLIDRDVYDGLDSTGKQRYILELSDKFRELKERYYKERAEA